MASTISELGKDDPQDDVADEQFSHPLTNAIIDHKGTIDKYMGDAVMAFWNAPLHEPGEYNACEAALEMLHRVDTLNQLREQQASEAGQRFIPIKVGVGINTGKCVVGNMGSDLRFNYSVLGDPVNLASRLEGQSKNYGVPIIIGSKTAAGLRDKFAVLELDCITVKGKTEPESVFTVLGRADVAGSERFGQLQSKVGEILRASRRDFTGAPPQLPDARSR
jgi:adenylate cyclase